MLRHMSSKELGPSSLNLCVSNQDPLMSAKNPNTTFYRPTDCHNIIDNFLKKDSDTVHIGDLSMSEADKENMCTRNFSFRPTQNNSVAKRATKRPKDLIEITKKVSQVKNRSKSKKKSVSIDKAGDKNNKGKIMCVVRKRAEDINLSKNSEINTKKSKNSVSRSRNNYIRNKDKGFNENISTQITDHTLSNKSVKRIGGSNLLQRLNQAFK